MYIPNEDGEIDDPETEVSEALAAFGLYAEGALDLDDEFALWPDCLLVFNFWNIVQTQWRTGPNGAIGLDYNAVEVCMNMHRIPNKQKKEFFTGLQAMERGTLKGWADSKGGRG